jgi:ABC-2 type transport system ATP-binding protein
MTPIIECRDVSKRFVLRANRQYLLKDRVLSLVRPQLREAHQEFWALRDVTLSVEAGETFGIVGPNGAGKTTLFRIIAGIFEATSGTVGVRGRMAPLLALGATFHPELTGRENIYMGAALFGFTTREIRAVESAIVEFSELGRFIDVPTKNYSSGMQLRLGFSIALEVRPDIFLMDEILAVGDEHFTQKCLRRLQDERHAGRTFLLATHNLGFVEEQCDRAALIVQGRVAALGTGKEVVARYRELLEGEDAGAARERWKPAGAVVSAPVTRPWTPRADAPDGVEGHVDLVTAGIVTGWVTDAGRPGTRLEVEVVYRDSILGRGVADRYRSDLHAAGIGDGRCGFAFTLPAVLPRSELVHVGVRLADSKRYLRQSEAAEKPAATTVSRFGGFWIDREDWIDRLARKHRDGELSDELSDAIFRFVRDGYHVVQGAVPGEVIDRLNADIDRLWHHPPPDLMVETFEPDGVHKHVPADVRFRAGATKLLDVYAFSSLAREAIAAPRVIEFLAAVFEDKPKVFQGLYFWKGAEQRFHKDTAYVKIDTGPMHLAATWLALEDVRPGAGELTYYIGSHRAPDFLFGGSSKWMEGHPEEHARFLRSVDEDAARYRHGTGSFLARKGDVLIWHGNLAHGDAPVRHPGSTRKSLVTHFTTRSDEPFYRRHGQRAMLTTDRCDFVSRCADVGGHGS